MDYLEVKFYLVTQPEGCGFDPPARSRVLVSISCKPLAPDWSWFALCVAFQWQCLNYGTAHFTGCELLRKQGPFKYAAEEGPLPSLQMGQSSLRCISWL